MFLFDLLLSLATGIGIGVLIGAFCAGLAGLTLSALDGIARLASLSARRSARQSAQARLDAQMAELNELRAKVGTDERA